MKKIVRQNTFETNSSSTHALCYTDYEDLEESNLYMVNDTIVVFLMEFDDCIDYFSQHDKLSYLITRIYLLGFKESLEELYEDWEYITIKESICKYTGAKDMIVDKESVKNARLNHQLMYDSFIDADNEGLLLNYIFNKKIYLEIGRD